MDRKIIKKTIYASAGFVYLVGVSKIIFRVVDMIEVYKIIGQRYIIYEIILPQLLFLTAATAITLAIILYVKKNL